MIGNARPNTQQAYFGDAKEVVLLHGRFYWTNRKEVFTEELNDGTFYHNRYFNIKGIIYNLVFFSKSFKI